MNVLFAEAGPEWQPVPQWAASLVRFGLNWPCRSVQRRIAVISMPCESAGAGLVALGSMIRDLGREEANEIDGHYEALIRYARQYLHACRSCKLEDCSPSAQRCGFNARADGRLRSLTYAKGNLLVSERTDLKSDQLVIEHRTGKRTNPVFQTPNPILASQFYIDGTSPIETKASLGSISGDVYQRLVPESKILPANLSTTWSGLCLAGRAAGERATRSSYASVRFRTGLREYGLDELLPIHKWGASATSISRMTYFNSRTEKADQFGTDPELVVADGRDSFLKVLGNRYCFQRSDVIGVISRAAERSQLEELGQKLASLHQWYSEDADFTPKFAFPRGITLLALRRRGS